MELWGRRSESVMQGFLFSLSAMAMVAPMVAQPFLGHQYADNGHHQAMIDINGSQLYKAEMQVADDLGPTWEPLEISIFGFTMAAGRALYPCIIVGLPLLFVAIARLISFIAERGKCVRHCEYIDEPVEREPPEEPGKRRRNRFAVYKKMTVFVTFFLVGVFTGAIELLWSGFTAGYAVKYHSWTSERAVLVPFVYWCVQSVGRLLIIPLARLVAPSQLFAGCSLCLLTSAIVMVVMTDTNPTVLMVISGCMGGFGAPLMGAGVSWVCGALRLTGLNSSIFYAGSSLGSMFMPMAIAKLCAAFGARMFLYINVAVNGAMFASVMLICVATFKRAAKNNTGKPLYELAVNESESELWRQRQGLATMRCSYNTVNCLQIFALDTHSSPALNRKWCHFGVILITYCTVSCHFDNVWQRHRWKFHQKDPISLSVREGEV